ncbi:ISAs1 family transposase [Streptomyces sp. NPDC048362]|uniref:ISAs1 family transposase n=1 Tax=Streptomyces sp. NPDC048362 TaxID=3365539 RepID=UPI003712A711
MLTNLAADALDTATCAYVTDVAAGTTPAPETPRAAGLIEREQRRAAQRAAEHPVPDGLLPSAALDGKALIGARTATGRVFLVGAVAHASGAVLGQTQVPDKRGEGEAARTLLTRLDLPGWVFTRDALHTTKKTARLITDELDAHYVLILKGNQPLARSAAQALLAGTDAEWTKTTAVEDDRGHGRTERRTIRTAQADNALFPGAQQVFRLRRDTGGLLRNLDRERDRLRRPASRPFLPAPPSSTTTSGHTGPSKTRSTGFETSPPRGQHPGQNRYCPASDGQLPQPGHQHDPARRTSQHRPRPPRPPRRLRCLRHLINYPEAGHNDTTPAAPQS